MARLSICRGCDRVVRTDGLYEADYVVVDTDLNGSERLMHAECYEAEMDEKEAKVTPTQKVG